MFTVCVCVRIYVAPFNDMNNALTPFFAPPVAEDAPDFCYGIDSFVAIIDCTMCSCTEKEGSDFCTNKSGPGQVLPPAPRDADNNNPKQCTPKETMVGTSAIMDYSSCTNLDSVSLLISHFDQNNFGQLDSFETCAHSYKDEKNHGGRTALSCMQILKNTMTNPMTGKLL